MGHVVEDTQEEDEVEDAHRLGGKIEDSYLLRLDLRSQGAMGEIEPRLGAPSVAAPAEVVGGKDPGPSPPLGFEREESVPSSDVENSRASQILGKVQRLQLFRCVVLSWGDNTVTQIDSVEPPDLSDCTP